MKIPPKPVKILYKGMVLLFTDPFNARLCMSVAAIVAAFFSFQVIMGIINVKL